MQTPRYVVLQVVLKEALIGTGSNKRSLSALEEIINEQCAKGFRLHTITTASSGSTGLFGGDRIQATLVFESLDEPITPIVSEQEVEPQPEKKQTLADFDI